MNREQVKEELLKGRTLEELFEFHPGQECDIYKGVFSLSDEIIYIPEEPWKERRWLNVDEIKIFLDETKESYPFWFPLHYIMIYTGMRIGEVGGLKWEDVHLEGGYIELKQALLAEYKQGKN